MLQTTPDRPLQRMLYIHIIVSEFLKCEDETFGISFKVNFSPAKQVIAKPSKNTNAQIQPNFMLQHKNWIYYLHFFVNFNHYY